MKGRPLPAFPAPAESQPASRSGDESSPGNFRYMTHRVFQASQTPRLVVPPPFPRSPPAHPPPSEVPARLYHTHAAIAIDRAALDRYYVRSQARSASQCSHPPRRAPRRRALLHRSDSHGSVHRDESRPPPLRPPRVRPGDAPVHARALDGVHKEGAAPRPPPAALQDGLRLLEHHRQLGAREPTAGRRRRRRLRGPAHSLVDLRTRALGIIRGSFCACRRALYPAYPPSPRASQDE
ncbi:hypothetical protein GSI_15534 [Ganoderma sinense ZZ0214-1]|uniref:Uncharacterized protein n=1 Tax=Ganoderma sinense ZZ0214-1 TaxID=1077348 RepID=A0A2G8RMV2_9APHY|nr:hypothetical protein GSI_15534 [Ganoderma sinense ZZ0214-1]